MPGQFSALRVGRYERRSVDGRTISKVGKGVYE